MARLYQGPLCLFMFVLFDRQLRPRFLVALKPNSHPIPIRSMAWQGLASNGQAANTNDFDDIA